jgi:nitrite reductase/ring-hydroxylating ferredoxin subunit
LDEATLADNSMEIVDVEGQKAVLIKRFGKIYALNNTCPHLGGSLGRGTLQGNTLICPLHHWTFDLTSGKCVSGVADEKLAVYEVKVEDGKIYLKMT